MKTAFKWILLVLLGVFVVSFRFLILPKIVGSFRLGDFYQVSNPVRAEYACRLKPGFRENTYYLSVKQKGTGYYKDIGGADFPKTAPFNVIVFSNDGSVIAVRALNSGTGISDSYQRAYDFESNKEYTESESASIAAIIQQHGGISAKRPVVRKLNP